MVAYSTESKPAFVKTPPKTHTPGSRLQQRGFRYYSPSLGRWLSRDPIGEVMRGKRICPRRKLTAEQNLYAFVHNDPPNRVDFLGLFDFCQCLKITEKVLVYKKGMFWTNPYYSEAILPPNAKPSTKGGFLCDRAYWIQITVEPRDGRSLLNDLNAPGNNQNSDCWLWDGTQIGTTFGWRNEFRYQPQVVYDVAGSGQAASTETLWEASPNAVGQWGYDFIASKSVFMWDAATINISLRVITPDGTQTCPIDGSPSPVQFQLTQQP